MSNRNPKNNSHKLIQHAQKKSEEAYKKVDEAIKKILKEKKQINFNVVAETASVSKPFLYNSKEIRERIEALRNQQSKVTNPKSVKQNMSDESKDAMIELLRNKIKHLEAENKKIKLENQISYGKAYDEI
jgi:hypothetical protein